jgi:hypothetical protein
LFLPVKTLLSDYVDSVHFQEILVDNHSTVEGITRSARMERLMKWSLETDQPVVRKVYFKK